VRAEGRTHSLKFFLLMTFGRRPETIRGLFVASALLNVCIIRDTFSSAVSTTAEEAKTR
jgi:hypothetical protein